MSARRIAKLSPLAIEAATASRFATHVKTGIAVTQRKQTVALIPVRNIFRGIDPRLFPLFNRDPRALTSVSAFGSSFDTMSAT